MTPRHDDCPFPGIQYFEDKFDEVHDRVTRYQTGFKSTLIVAISIAIVAGYIINEVSTRRAISLVQAAQASEVWSIAPITQESQEDCP